MESLSIPEQVATLFTDLSAFARLAADLKMENYFPLRYELFNYPLGILWLGIPKKQVTNLQEAFSALFLLDLHYQNDWIYSEVERTNPDQFIIERLPTDQWARLLQDKWIADYFGLSCRQLRVIQVEPAVFLQKFLWWMPEGIKSGERDALKTFVI